MSNPSVRRTRTTFHESLFLGDIKLALEADDTTINDHLQTHFVLQSFAIASQVLGFENIPLSILMDIADLASLKFGDYINVEAINDLPL